MATDSALLDVETEDFIGKLGIPPCPGILVQIMRAIRVDEPDFNHITKLISADVALAAGMLKAVNSSYYGLATKVTTVHRALAVLGMNAGTQILTRLALAKAMPGSDTPAMKRFWANSLRYSLIASVVARMTRAIEPELCATFLLFRDAGMGVLLAANPAYAEVMNPATLHDGQSLLDAEMAICGTNHTRVGFSMARSWELSMETQLAIFNHHTYGAHPQLRSGAPRNALRLTAIGLVVDVTACRIARLPCVEWDRVGAFAMECLELDESDVDDIVREAALVVPGASS